MSKAILILGANGFIGRHLMHRLIARGERVIALLHKPPELTQPDIESVIRPFNKPEDFAHLLNQARLIIHVASSSTPGLTAGKPLIELESNLKPSIALLEALQNAPHCSLVYLSSGGTLYGDTIAHLATEIDNIRPKSYYGAGKAAIEHFIHAMAAQFNHPAIILRPSNLYGPGQTVRNGFGIIPTAFQCIQDYRPLTIWGDGSAIRDYLYIDDFIRLCIDVIDQPIASGVQLFNAASGQGVSVIELINKISHITDQHLQIHFDSHRAVDVARIVLDPQKAASQYAWQPQVSLEQGLLSTWEWYNAQPST
jgi:UDP-glucose 4-epimerase